MKYNSLAEAKCSFCNSSLVISKKINEYSNTTVEGICKNDNVKICGVHVHFGSFGTSFHPDEIDQAILELINP